MYACIRTSTSAICNVDTYMSMYMYMYMYVHIHMLEYIPVDAHMGACVSMYVCLSVYVCMSACMHIRMHHACICLLYIYVYRII